MAPYDDAVKAATEALQVCTCEPMREGDLWREVDIDCPACGDSNARSRAAVSAAAPILLAAERARIAAAIRAAGHPDGYHRVDTTREWAGIYCADCAVTERSARIAETAPEEGS